MREEPDLPHQLIKNLRPQLTKILLEFPEFSKHSNIPDLEDLKILK